MQQDYTIELKETYNSGATFTVTVTVPMSLGWIEDMFMVTQSNHGNKSFKLKYDHTEDNNVVFKNDVFMYTSAVYRFYFTFLANNQRKYLNGKKEIDNYIDYNKYDKMSVNFDTPEWAKGATMYHIFVDRFNRGSDKPMEPMPRRDIKSWDDKVVDGPNDAGLWCVDFYGGDLKGITQKLDYIRSLGTDIIYLSPIVRSQSCHRYDTGDYEQVDPYAGTNDDLKELCDEAHKRNMKIVLDGVFNHTGDDSKYFNIYGEYPTVGASQDIDSYYGSFYKKWYNSDKTYFDYWWGMQNLPVCDGNSENWQEYIYGEGGVIDKWFALGIDGLRLDVADELTDNFIEGIRKAVKRNKKDGFIIGEVWKNAMKEPRGYLSSGKCLDTQMDYPLADGLIRYLKYSDVYKLRYILQDIINEYPEGSMLTLMNFTSTHDISRPIDIFGTDEFKEYTEWAFNNYIEDHNYCNNFKMTPEQYEKGKELFKTYAFAMNFMPGIFSIFYGDEIGLTGLGNMMNRCPFNWNEQDRDLLEYIRYLGKIRKEEEFLRKAGFNVVDINNHYLMFERTSKDADALVTINRTDEDCGILLPEKYESNEKIYTLKNSSLHRLTPYGGTAIIKK